MSDSSYGGGPFGRIAPTIAVTDMDRAVDFYTGVLGMSVEFSNGDPVGFVILRRESAELHLTLARGHVAGTHNVAHLLVSQDVRIIKGLRDADYGLRGFVFSDPDSNRIDVGQQL